VGESPPGFTMKSIYFNHIPRTGGTTLSRMLHNSGINRCGLNVFTTDKDFNSESMYKSDLIMGHYGIAPSIFNSDIDTITLLRNPVNQVVSMFSKLNQESQDPENIATIFEVFRSSKFKNDPANLFREWLYDQRSIEYTNNGQIYNLINTRYPYLYDPRTAQKVDRETQILVTKENAKDKIESLLFLGTTENIYKGYTQILEIINTRFDVSLKQLNRSGVYNSLNETGQVLRTLGKSEIDYILEKNSIDHYYWEQASAGTIFVQ
jgi:hypothetical protein